MRILFALLLIFAFGKVYSQNSLPEIGAEIFIEPGQSPKQIDTWFKRLDQAGMRVTRIRMFQTYMQKPDGTYDFALFDTAFKAGEKYNIKIYANLFPATTFSDVGGFKFPHDDAHLQSIADYIKNVVTHFNQFKSCYGWVPVNEPGQGEVPNESFSIGKYKEWLAAQSAPSYQSKGYTHFDFASQRFLVYYNTWFLKWLITEIHKYAPAAPIHVNNHGIFQNVAEYDFPAWQKMLTSLGGSAHASWHFGYFTRNQYAIALSANSEIIRSGAGNIPWLMTELQGGNNTYSGYDAMCPTKEEIAQWLWMVIGTGGKGGIFWCLNPRASGYEAGEWAMLNFQDQPSDRLNAASEVATSINKNQMLFANAKVAESGINIIYTRQSLWVEKKLQINVTGIQGRDAGGVMKSALAYYQALGEMGVQANFKEINEFDFTKSDYHGISIILAHQIAIPSDCWPKLENFVSKGGTLIADGLTAYYDENALNVMQTGFPLRQLFGADIKEFKKCDTDLNIQLKDYNCTLKGNFQYGLMLPNTATPLAYLGKEVIATRNKFGKGTVLWLPSLVGLGARISNNYNMLSLVLSKELGESITNTPFHFYNPQPGMVIKTMQSGKDYITILVNKSPEALAVPLILPKGLKLKPMFINPENATVSINNIVSIKPEETIVIKWIAGDSN